MFCSPKIAIVAQSAPYAGKLARTFQPILDAAKNFSITCSSCPSSLKVSDVMPILFGIISNDTTDAKSAPSCLNSTQMNLKTTQSIEVIRDKLDDLFDMERSNKTEIRRKKLIINIIGHYKD
jgi:hypothetical protein